MDEENKYLEEFRSYAMHDQFDPNVDIENIYSKECLMDDDCGLINNDFHNELEEYTYEQIKSQYAFGMINAEDQSANKSNSLLSKIFGESINHFDNEIELKDQRQEDDVARFFYAGKNKISRISADCSNANQLNQQNFENDENLLNYDHLDKINKDEELIREKEK